jgi:hypothetical protein
MQYDDRRMWRTAGCSLMVEEYREAAKYNKMVGKCRVTAECSNNMERLQNAIRL